MCQGAPSGRPTSPRGPGAQLRPSAIGPLFLSHAHHRAPQDTMLHRLPQDHTLAPHSRLLCVLRLSPTTSLYTWLQGVLGNSKEKSQSGDTVTLQQAATRVGPDNLSVMGPGLELGPRHSTHPARARPSPGLLSESDTPRRVQNPHSGKELLRLSGWQWGWSNASAQHLSIPGHQWPQTARSQAAGKISSLLLEVASGSTAKRITVTF